MAVYDKAYTQKLDYPNAMVYTYTYNAWISSLAKIGFNFIKTYTFRLIENNTYSALSSAWAWAELGNIKCAEDLTDL
jgi:hypothetical protein